MTSKKKGKNNDIQKEALEWNPWRPLATAYTNWADIKAIAQNWTT